MAILVLTSTCGSPGVTSTAVGLALCWPRSVLLADCDPGAHQSVLAGFLAGQSPNGKGLLRIAEAHRDRRPLPEVILDQTIPLAGDTDARRLFLPGFSKAGSAALFGGVWVDLLQAFDRLGDVGIDVIIDAGRCGGQGLPAAMVEHAAAVGLVLRSNLRSIMSARIHSASLTGQGRFEPDSSLGLVLVGSDDPYGAGEISKALGVPVFATVARDDQHAAHLSDGQPRSRKFNTSSLAKSLHSAAATLSGLLQQSTERVGSVR